MVCESLLYGLQVRGAGFGPGEEAFQDLKCVLPDQREENRSLSCCRVLSSAGKPVSQVKLVHPFDVRRPSV